MTLPVTHEDAKRQLRLEMDDSSHDAEIDGFISDAADWVEEYTGHILESRDVVEQFVGFGIMRLKAWPIAPDATVTLAYDAPGAVTTITGARLSVGRRHAIVLPPVSLAWPSVVASTVVTVGVRAGYAQPELVPGNLRRAMLVLISGYDEGGAGLGAAEKLARGFCSRLRTRTL